MDRFRGLIVHPQKWPEDLDYAGKRVVVIGSGATAATLIPAIAKDCAHVTMLQRSPTFFRTGRNAIVEIADELRRLQVDEAWIHEIVRRKILYEQSILALIEFRGDGGASHDQSRDEGAEESFAPAPGVVHELEEAEIQRQLLLRDTSVWPQPGA